MDLQSNPYRPGSGNLPPELAGRDEALRDLERLLLETQRGGARPLIFWGLRGVGKTVILNRLREMAGQEGVRAVMIEAEESRSVLSVLALELRRLLLDLSADGTVWEAVQRALGALASFVRVTKVGVGGVSLEFEYPTREGVADSGDLGLDLADLLEQVGLAAAAAGTSVALLIDELQYVPREQMAAITMAFHRITPRQLPLGFTATGLPPVVGEMGKAKSYAERFRYVELGALDGAAARDAIVHPARRQGVEYQPAALERILESTRGYPFFLQHWGHRCWEVALRSPITLQDVQAGEREALRELDGSFFKSRYDRMTPMERNYAHAMARVMQREGTVVSKSSATARELGREVTACSSFKNKLEEKGMIYSASHGNSAFSVPLFSDYLLRCHQPEEGEA